MICSDEREYYMEIDNSCYIKAIKGENIKIINRYDETDVINKKTNYVDDSLMEKEKQKNK